MPKTIIYQLLPRTFANFNRNCVHNGGIEQNGCGKMNDITHEALREIKALGATHVWYTGILEHATQTDYTAYGIRKDHDAIVKGKAGSPYAIKDFYDVDPDLATDVNRRREEFYALVERTHKEGMKVIMDFVPNHVAREYHSDNLPKGAEDLGAHDNPDWAFSPLNNFSYIPGERFSPSFDIGDYMEYPAKVTGNDCFTAHPSRDDWYETVKLNYGMFYRGGREKQFDPIPDTWKKMRDILLFWAGKDIDGFRCDMADMVPQEFWEWVIPQVKKKRRGILFIAEIYTPFLYKGYLDAGFDYLYDKVGMYDYLRAATSRNYGADGISQQWQQTDEYRDRMLYFLENHDEQRIASGFFCGRGMCAQPAMIVAATLGTNPVMIYAGQELGEKGMQAEGFSGIDGRSSIFDYCGVPSLQAWANGGKWDGGGLDEEQHELRDFYKTLLNIAGGEKSVSDGLMFDLEYAQGEGFNRHRQFAYLRHYCPSDKRRTGRTSAKTAKQETLLTVLNFDDKQVDIHIRIPREAFDYLKISEAENEVTFRDLLTEKEYKGYFRADRPFVISLEAWKGAILKLV